MKRSFFGLGEILKGNFHNVLPFTDKMSWLITFYSISLVSLKLQAEKKLTDRVIVSNISLLMLSQQWTMESPKHWLKNGKI